MQPVQAFTCLLMRAHEFPAASLAEDKAVLKLEKDEQRRKPMQDVASLLSFLESIEIQLFTFLQSINKPHLKSSFFMDLTASTRSSVFR